MADDVADPDSNTNPHESAAINCQNCGAPLQGRYCTACGQEHVTERPSLGRLFSELTAQLVDADSRLWRTMLVLLMRPGRIPEAYFAGRRVSYLPPLRLYLATSLVFFMLINVNSERSLEDGGGFITVEPAAEATPFADEPAGRASGENQTSPSPSESVLPEGEVLVIEKTDGPVQLKGNIESCELGYEGPWADYLSPRLTYACEQAKTDGGAALLQNFIGYVPTAMFLLMPFFAAAMKLFYWRPKRYFMEHLLFQLFNHSAFFAVGTLSELLVLVVPSIDQWLELPLFLYILFYAYQSLRVYYGQGRVLTLAKFVALGFIYLTLVLFGFAFAGLASVI